MPNKSNRTSGQDRQKKELYRADNSSFQNLFSYERMRFDRGFGHIEALTARFSITAATASVLLLAFVTVASEESIRIAIFRNNNLALMILFILGAVSLITSIIISLATGFCVIKPPPKNRNEDPDEFFPSSTALFEENDTKYIYLNSKLETIYDKMNIYLTEVRKAKKRRRQYLIASTSSLFSGIVCGVALVVLFMITPPVKEYVLPWGKDYEISSLGESELHNDLRNSIRLRVCDPCDSLIISNPLFAEVILKTLESKNSPTTQPHGIFETKRNPNDRVICRGSYYCKCSLNDGKLHVDSLRLVIKKY